MSKTKDTDGKSLKEQFDEAGQGHALMLARKEQLELQAQLDEAYGKSGERSGAPDTNGWNNLTPKELSDEWESLRRLAKIKYPEGIGEAALSHDNKLVAIAYFLEGWSYDKIAKAGGLKKSTVATWCKKRPDILVFAEKLKAKMGLTDSKEQLQAISAAYIDYVAKMVQKPVITKEDHKNITEAGRWAYEILNGKAADKSEVTITMADMFKEIQKNASSSKKLSEADEAKIFALPAKKDK